MGAACASPDEQDDAALCAYAQNVGAAFQIVDDILDVTSTDAVLGKPTGSDEKNDKTTYVSLLGVGGAKAAAARCTGRAVDALGARFGARADFLQTLANKLAVRAK